MKKITVGTLAGCMVLLAMTNTANAQELSADEIVVKNVAARGGLEAWRKIETMAWIGHIESPNAPAPKLPFIIEMKRPNKSRFQIEVQNQSSVNLFGGTHGWKVRTTRGGQPQIQPYSAEDVRFAQDGPGIDGPLIDYKAKGNTITLEGDEKIEGRKAYRLRVTLPSGAIHHVWVDARTFLDIKYDRESRNAFGQSGTVTIYYRDYRAIEGLQIPFTIETTAAGAKGSDKMVIDRILLNPPLEERTFARPPMPARRNLVSVDTPHPRGATHKQAWPQLSSPAPSLGTTEGR